MMPLLERGCQDQNAARRVTPLTFAHWQCVFSVLPATAVPTCWADALDYFQACPPRRDRLYYRNAMRGISISSGFRMEKFRGSAKAVQRGAVIGRLRALALVGLGVSLL